MELAVMTEPQMGGSYDDLLAAARWAEREALSAFARSDHYGWVAGVDADATDAFATMGGLARDTDRIRLTVLVSPITFRHPAVIAKAAASIDQMSGGRFELGVGTGWMESEHEAFGLDLPALGERFDRFEEALAYLRSALWDEHASYSGAHYRLNAPVRPRPTGPLPIIVGGNGARRTPRIAGTLADEYNIMTADGEIVRKRVATMREAAAAAGRDPDAIRVTVMGPAVAGRTEASYRENLAAAAARLGRNPEQLESGLLEQGYPVGTPGRVKERMAAIRDAGVDRFYLQHFDLTDLRDLNETLEVLRG